MKRMTYSEGLELAAIAQGPFSTADGAFRRTFVKICGVTVAQCAELIEIRGSVLLVPSYPENW